MLLAWLQKQFPAIIEQVKFTSNVVLEMEKAGFERTYVLWRKHKADFLFVPVKPGDRLELGTVEAVNKSTCLSRVWQFCDDTQKKALMNERPPRVVLMDDHGEVSLYEQESIQ